MRYCHFKVNNLWIFSINQYKITWKILSNDLIRNWLWIKLKRWNLIRRTQGLYAAITLNISIREITKVSSVPSLHGISLNLAWETYETVGISHFHHKRAVTLYKRRESNMWWECASSSIYGPKRFSVCFTRTAITERRSIKFYAMSGDHNAAALWFGHCVGIHRNFCFNKLFIFKIASNLQIVGDHSYSGRFGY